jgi:hypothetical protein
MRRAWISELDLMEWVVAIIVVILLVSGKLTLPAWALDIAIPILGLVIVLLALSALLEGILLVLRGTHKAMTWWNDFLQTRQGPHQ